MLPHFQASHTKLEIPHHPTSPVLYPAGYRTSKTMTEAPQKPGVRSPKSLPNIWDVLLWSSVYPAVSTRFSLRFSSPRSPFFWCSLLSFPCPSHSYSSQRSPTNSHSTKRILQGQNKWQCWDDLGLQSIMVVHTKSFLTVYFELLHLENCAGWLWSHQFLLPFVLQPSHTETSNLMAFFLRPSVFLWSTVDILKALIENTAHGETLPNQDQLQLMSLQACSYVAVSGCCWITLFHGTGCRAPSVIFIPERCLHPFRCHWC